MAASKKLLRPGSPARGTSTGRPIMVLLDLLGRRWVLRILWELREERLSFRRLQAACDNISPSVLNARLKDLRDNGLVDLAEADGYGLTEHGQALYRHLIPLWHWAEDWKDHVR